MLKEIHATPFDNNKATRVKLKISW